MSTAPLPETETDTFAQTSAIEPLTMPSDLPGEAKLDHYSERIWCDVPAGTLVQGDANRVGDALRDLAVDHDAARVVLLAPSEHHKGFEASGFAVEATIPGYYRGKTDCKVMRLALAPERGLHSDADAAHHVETLLATASPRPSRAPGDVVTELARAADAPELAAIIGETFAAYPTPSNDPAYVQQAIDDGIPFRVVRDDGEIVACASADLVRDSRTAELTDCATRPDRRGLGYMQAILGDLMDDLRRMDYPTAFTLARARVPGVNIAFQRLGFSLRGRMKSSVRIGTGIEDMNVWSRFLGPLTEAA